MASAQGDQPDVPIFPTGTPEQVFLNDLLALQVVPGGFIPETVTLFEKVKSIHLSEMFNNIHLPFIVSHLLPYLSKNGCLEEIAMPNPILFRWEYITAVKSFLSKITRPIKVTFLEEGHVRRDLQFNEENIPMLKELFEIAQKKEVTVPMMRMTTYLKIVSTKEYEKATENMIRDLIEIDDGEFPLLKEVGTLLLKAENLDRISIRDHLPVSNDFDYGEVFPWIADWMPKKLRLLWISLPICQDSLASLKWPGCVEEVGLRTSPYENRLAKVISNIDSQCPLLTKLDLCMESSADPNKAFNCLKPGSFKFLKNLQVKTSVHAEFLLNDASLINISQLPLQELILCLEAIDGVFHPPKGPYYTIPGSFISAKGITAISKIPSLLNFSVRLKDGWLLRKDIDSHFGKILDNLESQLEERKESAPPEILESASTYTFIAVIIGRADTNWFFTMPLGMRNDAGAAAAFDDDDKTNITGGTQKSD